MRQLRHAWRRKCVALVAGFVPCVFSAACLALCHADDTTKPKKPKGGSRWALLVGVDDYAEAQKLNFCGADMLALRDRLVSSGFPEQQVIVLHDKAEQTKYRPVKGNIQRQLELLLKAVDKADLVVVGFSGHGVHIRNKSYLCPTETRLDEPESMVPLDAVYQQLEHCPAALKLLLVDACRNDPRPGGQKSLSPAEATKQFAASLEQTPKGILMLTSCAPGQISMEDKDFGHGVFMHFVLEGLAGKADVEDKGRVSLLDLYKYANRQTKTHVMRTFNGTQTPALKGDLNDNFDLTLEKKRHIHVLLVANTKDAGIGLSLTSDLQNVQRVFQRNVPASQLHIRVLSGDAATPRQVLEALYTMKIQQDQDTVVFYCSGHGAFEKQANDHVFLIHQKPLFHKDIGEAFRHIKPRLAVLLADESSVWVLRSQAAVTDHNTPDDTGHKKANGTTRLEGLTPSVAHITPAFKSLFCDVSGRIDIVGSRPGEDVAGGPGGGWFTAALVDYLNGNKSSTLRWSEVVTEVNYRVHQDHRDSRQTAYMLNDAQVDMNRDPHN